MRLGIAVCKVRAGKSFVESLPSVMKISCFSQDERSAVQLPLDGTFTLLNLEITRTDVSYVVML